MLTVLQNDGYDVTFSPATFFGHPHVHDGSSEHESTCQIDPQIVDSSPPKTTTDGEVWLSIQKESALPSGTAITDAGYSGVMTDSGAVYTNKDGFQLHLTILLDPNDHTVEFTDTDGRLVQEMMSEFLGKWSTGSRPTLPN